jgi:hypothetical protein
MGQNDLYWNEVCVRHLTVDSVTTQDGDGYVSATVPLQLGATRFAFGEVPFLREWKLALTLVLILIDSEVRSDDVAQNRVYFCPGPRATLIGTSPMVLLAS